MGGIDSMEVFFFFNFVSLHFGKLEMGVVVFFVALLDCFLLRRDSTRHDGVLVLVYKRIIFLLFLFFFSRWYCSHFKKP